MLDLPKGTLSCSESNAVIYTANSFNLPLRTNDETPAEKPSAPAKPVCAFGAMSSTVLTRLRTHEPAATGEIELGDIYASTGEEERVRNPSFALSSEEAVLGALQSSKRPKVTTEQEEKYCLLLGEDLRSLVHNCPALQMVLQCII